MEQVIRRLGRDAHILVHLARHGFASPQNVRDEFFNVKETANHFRAIRRLKKRGLVEDVRGDGDSCLGYKPTRRGLRIASILGKEAGAIQPLRFQFRTTYDHDETLVRVRSIFEKSPVVSGFLPEQVIREELAKKYGHSEQEGSGYKVPDGLFQLRAPDRTFRVALELELTRKSSRRYRKIVKQLALSRDWDVVFFVARENSVQKVVSEILGELRTKDAAVQFEKFQHGFYFADLAQFLDLKLKCPFTGEGRTFDLIDLGKRARLETVQVGDSRTVTSEPKKSDSGKSVRG